MPAWEMHDGAKTLGPMSEEAVIWAIKQGLPSDTRVRIEGDEAWGALDEHPPFAEELVRRTQAQRTARRPKRWAVVAYEWLPGLAVVLVGVGIAAAIHGFLSARGDGLLDAAIAQLRGVTEAPRPVDSAASARAAAAASAAAAMSPAERVKAATALFEDVSVDARDAVCRARTLLETLSAAERQDPEASRALALVSSKELPLLRADQTAFETTRGIICRDGTKPKGCPCHGAHESCCVLHKGVASCEPLPTRIDCP